MDTTIVITVIGEDRSGLVEGISKTVASHGGNWLESRLSHLGGQFAGMVEIAVKPDRLGDLKAALEKLSESGLSVVARESQTGKGETCDQVATVEIVGQDRQGIVSKISAAMSAFGANVERLDTECRSAPMSGEMLFEAKARICLPSNCDLSELRDKLEEIAADLMVEVSLGIEN